MYVYFNRLLNYAKEVYAGMYCTGAVIQACSSGGRRGRPTPNIVMDLTNLSNSGWPLAFLGPAIGFAKKVRPLKTFGP